MRLGNTLCLMKTFFNIPFRYRGKNRKVKPPTLKDLIQLRQDFEREERNMFILRHPYLTPEQSHGHMIAFRDPNFSPALTQIKARNTKFSRDIRIENRFKHLETVDAWE